MWTKAAERHAVNWLGISMNWLMNKWTQCYKNAHTKHSKTHTSTAHGFASVCVRQRFICCCFFLLRILSYFHLSLRSFWNRVRVRKIIHCHIFQHRWHWLMCINSVVTDASKRKQVHMSRAIVVVRLRFFSLFCWPFILSIIMFPKLR